MPSGGLKTEIDTLAQAGTFLPMRPPCSDYQKIKGLIYFARMLDKIRLHAAGELPPDYCVGVDEPDLFDARCTRFLGVDYDQLAKRTLEGGTDEEILDWCFVHGRRPSEEEIEIWNAFLAKRGWRDAGSADLQLAKKRYGWGARDDIQTWVDLHDVDEGRTPGRNLAE
jgi:gluconokinase